MRLLLRIARGTSIFITILFAMLLLPIQPSFVAHAQSSCGSSVTVVPGDTLYRIAVRCNTTVAAILAANPQIRNRNLIYSGQVLTLPGGSENPGGGENPGSATVTISPSQGVAGSSVQMQASGFAANTPVEIGFGRIESEYDVIARTVTDANGNLSRQLQVPALATANDQFVFTVLPQGQTQEVVSNVFRVTSGEQPANPQVTLSPRSGSPGSNVQVAVSGFPANTRISYGLGEPGGQLLQVYSARTNALGSLQLTMQVPEVDPDTSLELVAYVLQPNRVTATSEAFTVTADNSDGDNLFTRTNIYLIALEDGGQSGMEIGCGDSVVPVEVQIEPTIAPLTAALGMLLAIDDRYYGQSGLYNALYQSDLTVDRIELNNGVASLYLTGTLQVGGVCDEPRVRAQLEETALQYYTVNEVQIFVNGQPLSF